MSMTNEMAGKVILVTGATNGIGEVTALELARQDATVALVARNEAKAKDTRDRIKRETGNENVDYLTADLSSMEQVRGLAEEFGRRYDRLDVLVNNAGAVFMSRRETVDGFERTFALNHLAYFLLTNQLLDRLRASAPARIVNVSSEAHERASLDLGDLQSEHGYNGMRVYGRSKLMNLLFTYELVRRLEGTGVTVNGVHPGFVNSGFAKNNGGLVRVGMNLIGRLVAITPEQGAQTLIYLASSPEVEGVSGKYFVKREPVRSSAASYDVEAARRLWEISAELVGLEEPAHA
jgi:NAD(P)-dependent dehydrogenase (short-subunit alcohol dehydrogenase family)